MIKRLILLAIAILLLLTFFAPSILSTGFGKKAFFKSIKSHTGYEIQSDEFKLQWLGGQVIKKIEVVDESGRSVFKADSIVTDAPLWKLLFFHDVGQMEIAAPFVRIEPPQRLAALMASQAGFVLAVSVTPSFSLVGHVTVKQGSAEFVSPGLEPISIKEIELNATLLPKQIKLLSSGLTEDGSFAIDLLAYPHSNQLDANIKLNHFPLRAADQIVSILYPDLKGVIRETIGESFDAEIRVKNLAETLDLYVNAHSDLFSASLETKVQDNTLQLASPAFLKLQIPPASFEKLTSLPIQSKIAAELKIDELSIPLDDRKNFKFQGTFKSDGIPFESWTLDPFSLYVKSSTPQEWDIKIDSPQIQFQGSATLPEQWENLSFSGEALLPKNTKLTLRAASLKSIAINLQGDVWKGQLKGALDLKSKTVTLTEPGSVSLELNDLPQPLPPLPVQVTLQPGVINLAPLSGRVKGAVEIPAFAIQNNQVGTTSLQFTTDLKTKQVQFSLASAVNNGPLVADGSLIYPTELKVKGSCSNFPVASLEPFIKQGPPLLPLIGETLTTNFQLSVTPELKLAHLSTTSPLLTVKAALKMTGAKFELLEPANFSWTLTPQGYATLVTWMKGSPAFNLSKPSTFTGAITTLSASLNDLPATVIYQGKLSSNELAFSSPIQKATSVSNIQLSLNHPQPSSPHQFDLSAKGLSCKGSFSQDGTADVKLLLEQFPSATFDLLAAPFSSKPFSIGALCGPILNLSAETTLKQWTGPVKFDLRSDNLRTSLAGALQQGTLTLTNPFHLQLKITRELSQALLDGASIRSEGPVTLEIKPQGFSYPLFPSNQEKIQVGAGRLELGKLYSLNDGNLQITLGLLKQAKYRSGDELELWFAPLDFKIQNGVVNCERTEILIAKEYQVCTWGTVNLPGDSVDGILGLTASCLKNAFGIQNLPENYVLQIPVYGSLSNIKIDKGKATTRIAALMIWQQKDAAAGLLKGPAGKFLGESLNKLGPLPGGDQKAPPAKRPFPWDNPETSSKKKTSDISPDNKKHIRHDESALKQALKLIR